MLSSFCPKAGRYLFGIVVAVSVATAALPSDAGDLKDDIEELREEQAKVKKEREVQAESVDASTAEVGELTNALTVLNEEVNQQEGRLKSAEARLVDAEKQFAEASQAVVNKVAEIEGLKNQVSDRAVTAFVDQNVGGTPVLENVDPNKAIRMQSLVESVARDEVDSAEQLRAAREDLALEEARAASAAAEAAELRVQIEAELLALQTARDARAALVDEAEARLEARLSEQAVLAERDQELAASIEEKNKELARQAALARARSNPAPASAGNVSYPSADQITSVQGIWVHVDIASDVDRMLTDARAAGIVLAGWGYRDHQSQIRLRRSHCGSSEYAIWRMPASQCSPPTARPGASMHEQGKAIDITYNGRVIGTRSSAAFQWLKNNADRYGLCNLPSEPWHWSVNCR